MQIYYFINYRKENLFEFIKKINDCNAIICLDLEDSVQDIFNPHNTPELKNCHRKFIKHKFNSQPELRNINFGIRLNPVNSPENNLDIDMLGKIRDNIALKSVFITKVGSKDDVIELGKRLDERKIKYNEIVAVIETQNGFRNLKEIVSSHLNKLRKIAFGYCDFNLDKGLFPFHHQDSEVYWNSVKFIISKTEIAKEVEFINSPFLELDNHKGFVKMLSNLNFLCKKNFGQITLTHEQSGLCRNFLNQKEEMNFEYHNEDINTEAHAKNITTDFEKFNMKNGFSVAGKHGKYRILISPHVYRAALKFLNTIKKNGN